MKKLSLISATLSALLLTSCGPEKSTLDLEREQNREQREQKLAENAALFGNWKGQLSFGEFTADISAIFQNVETLIESGGAEPKRVAKLMAVVRYNKLRKPNDPATGSTYTDFVFQKVAFFPYDNALVMESSNLQAPATAVINAIVTDNKIVGRYFPSYPLPVGNTNVLAAYADIVLTKVNEE